MPRDYAPELRRRVIDLIEGGNTVAEVAAMVEPTDQTIYNWWKRHLVDTGRRVGTPTIENSELLAARRRIADLEKELAATRRANELLKEVVPPKESSRPSQCGRRRSRRRTGMSDRRGLARRLLHVAPACSV